MTRVFASLLALGVASFSLFLNGCDTKADKGATPPSGNLATPSKGPTAGGAGNPGGGPGGSVAPMVLPPPPDK